MDATALRCSQAVIVPLPWRTRKPSGGGGPIPMSRTTRRVPNIQAFQRSDIDGFARDAWRSANDGFERFVYEAKKTAERLDRQYGLSSRFDKLARSAANRAREIDRELEIGTRWRAFTMDFSRNSPRYRKQLTDFFETPLGRIFATIFFLWFALSGWLFRILFFATWVLPFAAPLLIRAVANNLVIKGSCPACKRQFVGYKNQVIHCAGCGNTVWQPKGDSFSRDGRGGPSSKSDPEIIDVDFEER